MIFCTVVILVNQLCFVFSLCGDRRTSVSTDNCLCSVFLMGALGWERFHALKHSLLSFHSNLNHHLPVSSVAVRLPSSSTDTVRRPHLKQRRCPLPILSTQSLFLIATGWPGRRSFRRHVKSLPILYHHSHHNHSVLNTTNLGSLCVLLLHGSVRWSPITRFADSLSQSHHTTYSNHLTPVRLCRHSRVC